MRYEFNVSGENRKALVKTIADFTGQKAKYNGVPSCSYSIGEFTVTKDGALEYEGEENLAGLLQSLADAGFVSEQDAPQRAGELTDGNNTEEADTAQQSEPTGLTVEIPLEKVKVGNLTNLLDAKGDLIKKALGVYDLGIEIKEDRVAFPWFSEADPESVRAYTHFISALCKMSMDQQRITAKAKQEQMVGNKADTAADRYGTGGYVIFADYYNTYSNLYKGTTASTVNDDNNVTVNTYRIDTKAEEDNNFPYVNVNPQRAIENIGDRKFLTGDVIAALSYDSSVFKRIISDRNQNKAGSYTNFNALTEAQINAISSQFSTSSLQVSGSGAPNIPLLVIEDTNYQTIRRY
ncbi:hypothetical protein [Ruminococcus flavefaciens]|uniref:hypothetical protein n=1 Tax=Ruminococcus flavefaciens TaxID=1265 RepID=UPI0026EAF37D|nr:hypothetical protein [Ruminococcus flavefaciens]